MRLNSEIKSRLKVYLTEKAFSKEKEKSLYDDLRKKCEKSEYFKERKRVYNRNPEFIKGSSIVYFRKKIKGADGCYRNKNIEVSLSYTFALAVKEWDIIFSLDIEDGIKKADPEIWESANKVFENMENRWAYENKLESLMKVTQTSTAFIKILPESEPFFTEEIVGVSPSSALINKNDIDFIRGCLNKEEKTE